MSYERSWDRAQRDWIERDSKGQAFKEGPKRKPKKSDDTSSTKNKNDDSDDSAKSD